MSDDTGQFKAESVHQIGILVKEDPEELCKEWEKLFGISGWQIVKLGNMFKLALVDFNGVQLELAQPLEGESYHKEHVEKYGNTGLHHICFPVADVAAETKKFEEQGGKVLTLMPGCAYIQFPKAGNVIIELIPKRD